MGPVPLRLLLMAGLIAAGDPPWQCPELSRPHVSCTCDLPHTLRCVADRAALGIVARRLRILDQQNAVSLLDVTMQNETRLPPGVLSGVALHGLVISSGQLTTISPTAFAGLATPLQALGLPSNLLKHVPTAALQELPGLGRLDLSHNKLVSLNVSSFFGSENLTFLDLSDNQLQTLASDCFSPLTQLRVLRLRGNHINVGNISNLTDLNSLIELDLSRNALVGPLGPTTLPSLSSLETLLLSDNQLSSVRRGMLRTATNLLTLNLNHNQIDVVEDHAFLELSKLRTLDLANNRIVAVSGASLAHLTQLTELDLAHNFLRALTADLVVPLVNLRELRLDDNDISMVASDALSERALLQRLTLADNPLNCDCTLIEFSNWLSNASSLPAADRRTAVCATPPTLENALLSDIAVSELRCGEDLDAVPSATVPLSNAHVTLRAFRFDGTSVTLLWSVDSEAMPFSCDALFIYEEMDDHEVLLSSTPIRCNSSQLADPTTLTVRLPTTAMELSHLYRYCVVLFESANKSDDAQLVLGCSEVIPLAVTAQSQAQPPARATTNGPPPPHITSVSANLTGGTIVAAVSLWDMRRDPFCRVTITVLAASSLAAQHHVNCSAPRLVVTGLPSGPYHVCATLGAHPPAEPRVTCIPVPVVDKKNWPNVPTALIVLVSCLSFLVALLCFLGKYMRRPRIITTHQCFLAAAEQDDVQHPRYVKLQATTKL